MLKDNEELLARLRADEAKRDRDHNIYTFDVLVTKGGIPRSILPMPNQDVAEVIAGRVPEGGPPQDEGVEAEFLERQQAVLSRNQGSELLCEAQNLESCLREHCVFYDAAKNPPVCREFKIVVRRKPRV